MDMKEMFNDVFETNYRLVMLLVKLKKNLDSDEQTLLKLDFDVFIKLRELENKITKLQQNILPFENDYH